MRAWQVTVAHRELQKAGVAQSSSTQPVSFQAQEA